MVEVKEKKGNGKRVACGCLVVAVISQISRYLPGSCLLLLLFIMSIAVP